MILCVLKISFENSSVGRVLTFTKGVFGWLSVDIVVRKASQSLYISEEVISYLLSSGEVFYKHLLS